MVFNLVFIDVFYSYNHSPLGVAYANFLLDVLIGYALDRRPQGLA